MSKIVCKKTTFLGGKVTAAQKKAESEKNDQMFQIKNCAFNFPVLIGKNDSIFFGFTFLIEGKEKKISL
jgi:hypothetical protein